MMGVGQDVAVEYLGELAVVVVGELPVGCPFGLGVVHRLEADPVIARKRTDAGGFLLPPVGQRVGLGMSGLVDDQEPAAVGVLYVDQVPLVGDLLITAGLLGATTTRPFRREIPVPQGDAAPADGFCGLCVGQNESHR